MEKEDKKDDKNEEKNEEKKVKKICSVSISEIMEFSEDGKICSMCKNQITDHIRVRGIIQEKDKKVFDYFANKMKISAEDEKKYSRLQGVFNGLKNYFYDDYKMLKKCSEGEDSIDIKRCIRLQNKVLSSAFSATKKVTYNNTGVFLDDLLGSGKDGEVQVYRGYHEMHDKPVAVKVFPEDREADFEFNNYKILESSPYVLKAIGTINIEHPNYFNTTCKALVMPILSVIASDFVKINDNYEIELPSKLTKNIITAMLDVALTAKNNGYCVCDMKLNNIGIDSDGKIRLFDFGGLVEIGKNVREYTKRYALDFDLNSAGEILDMNTIAVTAALCSKSNLFYGKSFTRSGLLEYAKNESWKNPEHFGWKVVKIFTFYNSLEECSKEMSKIDS